MSTETKQPHDDVIRRLEADLDRRREKLNKKATAYNKKKFNITRDLLERWKKDRESKSL
jgi:hypothetical protein